ncbi:MAG: hypothetical protein WCI53_04630 [Bacteroidota bacterium]
MLTRVTSAQQNSTYNIDFVKSVQYTSDSINHILAILKVTPTVKDFKMILSMRVTYEIGQGEKVVNLQIQSEHNIIISIYGKDLQQKNIKLYNLIKDSVNLNTSEDTHLIVFDFHDITKTQIDNMTIKYGLWEGINEDIRNEKTFNFKVNKID